MMPSFSTLHSLTPGADYYVQFMGGGSAKEKLLSVEQRGDNPFEWLFSFERTSGSGSRIVSIASVTDIEDV